LSSSARRRARSSARRNTKIFTSACGQTTVPMSRPSSTAPGRRCREVALERQQAPARTSGIADTIEAASRSRDPSGLLVELRRIERALPPRPRDPCRSSGRPASSSAFRDRAIDQPGVEMAQAK
jgi:hypothetical protein